MSCRWGIVKPRDVSLRSPHGRRCAPLNGWSVVSPCWPPELLEDHGWAFSCPHPALASCGHRLRDISLSLESPCCQRPVLTG